MRHCRALPSAWNIKWLAIAAFQIWAIGGYGDAVCAQTQGDPTENAFYRLGALAFTPALVFSSGYDTNVYREAIGFADYETFAVPQIEAWWTQPGFQVSAHAAVEGVRFQHNVGATNAQVGARIDRSNSLVTPYLSWNRRRTNASPTGFEVGYKSLRLENDVSSGAAAALTPRTRIRGLVRLVRTNWDADARYQSSSLREKLNRDTLGSSLTFSHDLTPLTSVGINIETQQDRFKYSPIRDGNSTRVGPVVEFGKRAWVFGNATVGYERFRSPSSGAADFNGVVGSVNLGYGLSDGTLLKLYVNRDLQYSYDPSLAYYVATSVTGTLARRVGQRWDLATFGGRYLLDFGAASAHSIARPADIVTEFGGAIAYRSGTRTRVGWTIERAGKSGTDGYQALRIVGFLTYGSGRFQRLDRPTPFER